MFKAMEDDHEVLEELELDVLTKETSGFISNTEDSLSIDDLVDKLFLGRTWKYTLLLISFHFLWFAVPAHMYITVYAGIDPTSENSWSCVSEKCKDLVGSNSSLTEIFPCRIIDDVNGTEERILQNSDIEWDLNHTSFSIEFDLYCDDGDRRSKKTLLSSIFFAGSLTGLILGGYIIDHIGRKKTAILGYLVLCVAVFTGTVCHKYIHLLVIRFFQGLGFILLVTGMMILAQELTPKRYRNYIIGLFGVFAAFGHPVAVGLNYFIPDWNFKFLGTALIIAIASSPVFTSIESPRYYLVKKDFESAKKSLKSLASLTTANLELDRINLTNLLTVSSKIRKQTFKQQLKDLKDNPIMVLETAILMFLWFCEGMFFFSFNFGWEQILPNIYLGYLMAGVGELLSMIFIISVVQLFGRKRAHILGFLGAMTSFLLAIPEVELGGQWTMESIFCLVGFMFVSGCFSGIYLWTGELAPTSHQGIVFCACSSFARFGSFAGPYIFNNLAPVTHRAVPFVILAVLAALCAIGSFFLVETSNKNICLTARDVTVRRKKYSDVIG